MFEDNIKLVYLVYNRRIEKSSAIFKLEDDLIQEGMIGLHKGCCTYNPEFGIKASTYLSQCIENAMLEFLRREYRATRAIDYMSLDDPVPKMDPEDGHTIGDTFEYEEQEPLPHTIDEMIKCYEAYIKQHGNKTLKNNVEKNKRLLRGVLQMINKGYSYRTIGKKFGLSRTNVNNKILTLRKALLEYNYI